MEQTLNNFTIIKSITIILMCLTVKEKSLLFFFALTHTAFSFDGVLFLSGSLLAANPKPNKNFLYI